MHVDDASSATLHVLGPEFANQNIIISGNQPMRVADLFRMIGEMLGRELEIRYQNDPNSGHYQVTPYAFMPRMGRKLVPPLTVDLGQGILRVMEEEHRQIHPELQCHRRVPGSGLFPCGARPVPVMKRPPGAAPVFPSSPCRAVPAQGEVMNIIAIIPARMGSSRFPGKPLALIHGVPMVGHVAFRTAMSRCLSATYVATCDTVIEDYCKEAGLACVMTGDHHVRCSTRTAEALLKIEAATGRKADIVVMVQGDEPMVLPGMIDAAVEPMLKDPTINVVNLMADMDTLEEFEDPNEVKVVVDRNNDALYFSREPIPSRKKGADKVPMRKQVCIIPFRRDYLIRFNEMEESPLEICESVDMMRILEHGEKVRMVPTDARTWSVDTPEDLARVTRLMEGDALMREYAK